jgi:hypothetical protein
MERIGVALSRMSCSHRVTQGPRVLVKGWAVIEDEETASPRLVGLSIELGEESPYALVLKLGSSRFECVLELDHPDFAIGGGHFDATYTLDCWISELQQLSAGGGPVVLLPFNFSDQCSGWLRVGPVRDRIVEVQAGWSGVSQYELAPADLTAAGSRIFDFEPVRNARIERPLAEIIAAVIAAREALADNLDHVGMAPDGRD